MAQLYIHIPFCAKRCFYCDFHSGTNISMRDRYIDALARELQMRIAELNNSPIETIYIGGGTPSQLTQRNFEELFGAISKHITLSQAKEITIEVNPDDITIDYAKSLSALPINRVSMGVQSFNDRLLNLIGRRHNAETAIQSYNILRNSGFDNISIDLMFSLPTQSEKEWEESIATAIELKPQHISAYDLSYEEGSVLTKKLKNGEFEACPEDYSASMYNMLVDKLLCAGYEHYEISNFAKPGYCSQHNSGYWKGVPYLGIGASAHSFDGEVRRANIANTLHYIDNILSGKMVYETEQLTKEQRYNETIFTRIRTSEGVSISEIEAMFGKKNLQHLLKESASYIESGCLKRDGDKITLTRKGILISDAICCNLFL